MIEQQGETQTQSSSPPDYRAFLAGKRIEDRPTGLSVPEEELHPRLFPFQRSIVRWALKRGRAACFAGTGLGKTAMQLCWAHAIHVRTGEDVLILAPLAVSRQTAREGERFDIPVTVCRTAADLRAGINVTNYERLHHFDAGRFGALVLDESSILKSFGGTVRKQITEFGSRIPFRLACTATPAPNDLIELINHAEFLSIMNGKEIIALFFTQDGNSTHDWRLKGHARQEFWRWMASWSVALRSPADLGFPDDAFRLPPLRLHPVTVECDVPSPGSLFAVEARTLEELRAAMRASLPGRVAACAQRVNASDETWLVWCYWNAESTALKRAIPDAVQVTGSDTAEFKEQTLLDFAEGKIRVLVSKPSLAGFGMNFQCCSHVAFVGLSHSFEQYYQAIRRCWRFGQQRPVECYVVTAANEGAVVRAIERKEAQAEEMMEEIVSHMQGLQMDLQRREEAPYAEDVARGADWTLYLGDSVHTVDRLETESVGLAVFSPPFPSMYVYTNTPHDMGNVRNIEEMLEQFRFLAGRDKLLRVLMPGRLCAMHLCQLMTHKNREGYVGLEDYRGRMIRMMQGEGWIYAGEVTIDKNPQMRAARTKEHALLFKSLAMDSSIMRMTLADYLIYFRKPGENPAPVRAGVSKKYHNPDGWITEEEWIEWAAPVWYRQTKEYPGGIRETDVLNVAQVRETEDERHLCALQLGVIERAVKLWTNPGELVYDPFTGIGSSGVVALQLKRRFVGCELKEQYFRHACRHLRRAEAQSGQPTLFSTLEGEEEEENVAARCVRCGRAVTVSSDGTTAACSWCDVSHEERIKQPGVVRVPILDEDARRAEAALYAPRMDEEDAP